MNIGWSFARKIIPNTAYAMSTLEFQVSGSLIVTLAKSVKAKDSGLDYLTLSYVWGKSSDDDPATGPDLAKVLPTTMEDAVQVVKSPGYRYLWVDPYCVPQENGPEKSRHDTSSSNSYLPPYLLRALMNPSSPRNLHP